MRTKIFIFSLFILFLSGCNNADFHDLIDEINNPGTVVDDTNDVLMLVVDYTSNRFEGGKILNFSKPSETFTITNEYAPPGDFGSLKLYYSEINELLFYGTIVWMGCGNIIYPENILSRDDFQIAITNDYVYPANGFENVFNSQPEITYNYDEVWSAVQPVVKAREYLSSNPEQIVKMFLYTPSVGCGDPNDWKWIVFMNK
ncbi:MAG: hypothetical protein LBQ22_04210 [Bacteroidales bacterium]|jgi:hypothetical protein|nr:hypothetical protein [Bacteroidales bacterium]